VRGDQRLAASFPAEPATLCERGQCTRRPRPPAALDTSLWSGASNLRHLLDDHPERNLSRDEIEQALSDRDRIESTEITSAVSYYTVVGATRNGRLLVVVWVEHLAGRFPVHARQAGRRAARRYYR